MPIASASDSGCGTALMGIIDLHDGEKHPRYNTNGKNNASNFVAASIAPSDDRKRGTPIIRFSGGIGGIGEGIRFLSVRVTCLQPLP